MALRWKPIALLVLALIFLIAAQAVMDVEPGWRAVGGLVLAGLAGGLVFQVSSGE